jgi:hypothetical protein
MAYTRHRGMLGNPGEMCSEGALFRDSVPETVDKGCISAVSDVTDGCNGLETSIALSRCLY